ncbi:zinc finger and SCAN domain-containing protein 21-like isoform X2 [Pangasianodon hypophthalmus]|nr:zinc finger and SCAN domain-containing protein 21-like isoform X2 [Pangasianodon hypophthalmus]
MKTAVSDICALAESWFQSLHMEIARSKKENEDLRQKLQRMQEQNPQAAAETELESQSTKEEKDEDTGSEVRDTDDSGCTVFAGTSTEDLAASAQLWLSSSEEDSKKRNFSATESAPAERAHSRWNHTPVGTKAEMMDRSIGERVEPKLDDTEINSQCYVLSSELKTEPEKFQPALQTSECSIDVGSDSENESEECVMLDEVCETESPQQRREEEQEFDVSCLWTPDLEPNSTHLLRENQSAFTNSDCTMTTNLGKDLNLAVATKNAQHLDLSKMFPCEKGSTFTCNICGKNLSTKNSLASHYRLHTGEKPFTCAQCGKSFAKKFNLDIHYNIHTGAKPYICANCPKSFADPSAFRRHEWIHTRKSQQNTCNTKYKFSCNTCGKCFLSKPSLTAHSQLHTSEKRHGVQKVLF